MAKGPKPLRNWAAMDPLMRKGGAHQTAREQTRPRMDWRQALDEFEDLQVRLPDAQEGEINEGPDGPSFLSAGAATKWCDQSAQIHALALSTSSPAKTFTSMEGNSLSASSAKRRIQSRSVTTASRSNCCQ